jgi:VanZ family protein
MIVLLPLRFPRLWLGLGWFFVALALFFCLIPGGIPGTADVNDKLMHVLGYVALTIWFTGIYPRSRYAVIALSLLAMGIGVEILQGVMNVGRVAEVRDVVADAIGIAIGIAVSFALLGGWAQRVESWMMPRG